MISLAVMLGIPAALGAPTSADASPEQIQGWLDSVVLLVTGPSWCSGAVIDEQGTIATAYHCVANGRVSQVTLRDGRSYTGETVAVWPREDLALVSSPSLAADKNPARPLQVRADAAQIGERVYGLGHPLAPLADRSPLLEGTLRWSVTEGVISNVGTHFIQTDAALNPGNSGGPVVDCQGAIVGVVSRKLDGDNLAFAVTGARLQTLIAERTDREPSFFGGTIGLNVGLATPSDLEGALTGLVRVEVDLRDRLIVSAAGGLPYQARAAAEAWGNTWYPWADLSIGGRARLGRGTWSTAVEGGASAVVVGGYTWDEDLGAALSDEPVVQPGGYARVELAGVGIRLTALPRSDDLDFVFTVEINAPGVLTTF